MHEMGYNVFTLPKLTYVEIGDLVKSFNEREKKKEQQAKKAKRKKW